MHWHERAGRYIGTALKWLPLAAVVGALSGVLGAAFHGAIEVATAFRLAHSWTLYLLPVGAVVIFLFYKLCGIPSKMGTDLIIEAARSRKRVPLALVPAVFVGTVLTHFVGGSAGREGAALQLGGGLGNWLGRVFRLKADESHMITLCGMAAVFSALFGTPVTAALFVLEVTTVGSFYYAGLLPCLTAALTAFGVAGLLGAEPVRLAVAAGQAFSVWNVLRIAGLGVACGAVSIGFCLSVEQGKHWARKLITNKYIRGVIGGVIVLGLTLLVGTQRYNGAGMELVAEAVAGGEINWYDFLLKLLFTVITIAAGYRGGEIVPTFFVGAAFGAVFGPLLGLNAGLAAAVGMVAAFCGVTNCPVASVFLGVEVFGGEYMLFFMVACALSYVCSGYFSLYSSQTVAFSKVVARPSETDE